MDTSPSTSTLLTTILTSFSNTESVFSITPATDVITSPSQSPSMDTSPSTSTLLSTSFSMIESMNPSSINTAVIPSSYAGSYISYTVIAKRLHDCFCSLFIYEHS